MRCRVVFCIEGSVGCLFLRLRKHCAIIGEGDLLELFLHSECLGYFAEFSVTKIRSLEVAFDSDDSLGSWHLDHQVSVVRDCHEPSECRAPQDRVVLRFPVNNLKVDLLRPEVAWLTKNNWELQCPEWQHCFAWDYAMEGCIRLRKVFD